MIINPGLRRGSGASGANVAFEALKEYIQFMGALTATIGVTPTFARGTNAYNPETGLIPPHNLLLQSNVFTNASWSKTRLNASTPIVTGESDPFGGTTASRIVEDGTSSSTHYMTQNFTKPAATVPYTLSGYFKNPGNRNVALTLGNTGGTQKQAYVFDLSGAGAISSVSTAGTLVTNPSARIELIGNGWYRCSITATVDSSITTLGSFVNPANGTGVGSTTYSGDNASYVLCCNVQLVNGSNTLAYIGTTSSNVPSDNLPRFVSGRMGQAVFIEEGSTNQLRNSTMVGAAAGSPGTAPTNWSTNTATGVTRTIVGTGTDSYGHTYIDVRFAGTVSVAAYCAFSWEGTQQIAATSAQTWTNSAYISLVGGSWPSREVYLGVLDCDSGGAEGAGGFTDIRSLVTGTTPVRVSHTRTLTYASTAYVAPVFRTFPQVNDVIDFTVRIAAPQLEQKAYATSFIPTTSASVTRNKEDLSFNPTTVLTAATGTVACWVYITSVLQGAVSTTKNIFDTKNGTGNANRISLYKRTVANTYGFQTYQSDGITNSTHTSPTIVLAIGWHHFVGVWGGSGGTRLYIDGVLQSGSPGTSNVPSVIDTLAAIGESYAQTDGTQINTAIDGFRIYNRALTASEIAAIYRSGK